MADIQEGFASEERLLAELNDWKSPEHFEKPSPKTIRDFILIAPKIADSVKRQLLELDAANPDVDIIYMTAKQFLELAKWWDSKTDKALDIYPLVKFGTEPDELESAKHFLEKKPLEIGQQVNRERKSKFPQSRNCQEKFKKFKKMNP